MALDPLEAAIAGDAASWAREHLEHDVVAWLTTVSSDGRPQSAVISFLHDRGTILFYSRPDTPKLRNIAANPGVSFHLQSDSYGDHYLIITGTAAVDPATPPSDIYPPYQRKYVDPLRHWAMDEAETARDFSVPIRIKPGRVRVA